MSKHVRIHPDRHDPERAFAAGRIYGLDHELPPCSTWLEQQGYRDPCLRHWFIEGFKFEKACWPFSKPFDPHLRECRCATGCNQELFRLLDLACEEEDDDLPYPYFGA